MKIRYRRSIKCTLMLMIIASSFSFLRLLAVVGSDKYSFTGHVTKASPSSTALLDGQFFIVPNKSDQSQPSPGCRSYPWSKSNGEYYLTSDERAYFRKIGNLSCLLMGTNISQTNSSVSSCACLAGWHGNACSIPESVWISNIGANALDRLRPRLDKAPRRLIHAFPFNNEFEMLEARLAEYEHVVDVFMVLESNYSAHGDAKPLRLLDRLRLGYLRRYACRIVHVFLGYFPAEAHKNGWAEDSLLRDYLAQHGLKHQLKNYDSEDIFFLTDADELARVETLAFLKLHDGYPEPVGHHLSAHTFGFFWTSKKDTVHVITAVSVGLLTQVLSSRAIQIRSAPAHLKKSVLINVYLKTHPLVKIRLWSFGAVGSPTGWHCSWCCDPECIRNKLLSAQNGDYPRWGDFPEKNNLVYIKYLIKTGLWFDNSARLVPRRNTTKYYAPEHFLRNYDKYRNILENPYASTEIHVNSSILEPFQRTSWSGINKDAVTKTKPQPRPR